MPGGCQASLAQPLNYHSTPTLQLVHRTLYRITWFELKSTRWVEQKHCTIMHQKHFIMHTLVNLIIMHWTKKIFPIPISSHAGKATSHALNIGWSYSHKGILVHLFLILWEKCPSREEEINRERLWFNDFNPSLPQDADCLPYLCL